MADTFALALTGLDATNPVPGSYAEVRFAQGETGGDLGPKRTLLLAPKTSAGSITVDTQVVQILDEADAITYAGPGSPAHRMARAFFANNKSSEVWLLCPTVATGSAAVDKIILTNAATANGVLSVYTCGIQIDVPIVSGDSVTAIGAKLEEALDNHTELPFTSGNSSGTVTVTGKIAGIVLNSVRIRCKITGAGATTVNLTADTAFGASGESGAAIGVGAIDLTNALATMLARKFDTILFCEQNATPIDALLDQVQVQAEPSTGYRQKVYVGAAMTPANAATLASGSSMNRARADLINCEECPVEHYVLCAIVAGAYLKNNGADPSYNFDGYGTKSGDLLAGLSRPYNDSALPTTAELKSMLNQGVTPIAFTDGGAPYIVRAVTTQCKSGSNFDYRVRDAHIVTVPDRFTADLLARVATAPWTKITRDPTGNRPEPGAAFCTPRRMKSLVERLLSDYVSAGWLDPVKLADMIAGTVCGQDPLVPSRMNTSIPLYSAILLHQHALLVKESSAAT